MQISGFVLIVAIAIMVAVVCLLGASLGLVAQQTRRISNFEPGNELNTNSVTEPLPSGADRISDMLFQILK